MPQPVVAKNRNVRTKPRVRKKGERRFIESLETQCQYRQQVAISRTKSVDLECSSARALLFYVNRESWFASPNFCIREPFPANTHPSNVRHGAWLNCESQPDPVPPPLSLTT